ncbi:hypothetical protein DPMN_116434 [Dreissena polymorpha]|uniref:CCHC-type domain-containing protein n=1 Tax=Dreissena polymorpha TaxID=45954 RepID=A0A9D4KNY1_DREPO|nr:hypothetical protein DPMN_116434 [Dreissena polymorpha]
MNRVQLVDIDTAPVTELQTVPGIGARVAQSIVSYREFHGSITPDALVKLPYIRPSSQMWNMIRFSKSESGTVNELEIVNEGEDEGEGLEAASELVVVPDTNLGLGVIERVTAAIDSASLSGPPASYIKSSDAKKGDQGARSKVIQERTEVGFNQGSVEQSVQYLTVTPSPMPMEPKSVHYQAATQPSAAIGCQQRSLEQPVQYRSVTSTQYIPMNHSVQSGSYQAMAQMPQAHGTYPVQFHAMGHGAQPGQYQIMTHVPVSQAGQLQYMLVGSQGQLIDPVDQPHMTYMTSPVQSGYVAAPQVVPTPQVCRSVATPRCVSRHATHAVRGATNNTVAPPVGQRAMLLGKQKSRIQSLPKALVYDGRGSWHAFLTKFEKYAGIFEWDDFEKRDFLCLCLTDKASEYYALVMDREVELGYIEVVDKLERRFGYRELPETARVTFSGARQGEEESVDDWADRVLTLAGKAFRGLPEEYMVQEAILKFCMGAKEREAGEQVINQRPVSIEQAIDKLKWAIHTHGLMYGRPKLVRKVECEGQVEVAEVKVASQNRLVERVVKLEEKMDILMGKLDQLLARPTRSQSPSPARRQCFNCNEAGHFKRDCPKLRSRTPSPARGDRCYRCNELGHMARDCPKQASDKVGDTPREGRKVSFADLNGKGSV